MPYSILPSVTPKILFPPFWATSLEHVCSTEGHILQPSHCLVSKNYRFVLGRPVDILPHLIHLEPTDTAHSSVKRLSDQFQHSKSSNRVNLPLPKLPSQRSRIRAPEVRQPYQPGVNLHTCCLKKIFYVPSPI